MNFQSALLFYIATSFGVMAGKKQNGTGDLITGTIVCPCRNFAARKELIRFTVTEYKNPLAHPFDSKAHIEINNSTAFPTENMADLFENSYILLDTIVSVNGDQSPSSSSSHPLAETQQLIHPRDSVNVHMSIFSKYVSLRYRKRFYLGAQMNVFVFGNFASITQPPNGEDDVPFIFAQIENFCLFNICITLQPMSNLTTFDVGSYDRLNFSAHYFYNNVPAVSAIDGSVSKFVTILDHTKLLQLLTAFDLEGDDRRQIKMLAAPYALQINEYSQVNSSESALAYSVISTTSVSKFNYFGDIIEGCNNSNFLRLRNLGAEGCRATVFTGKDLKNLTRVIIKKNSENLSKELEISRKIYSALHEYSKTDPEGIVRIPRMYPCQLTISGESGTAMEILGPDLSSLCTFCFHNPIECYKSIGLQLLDLVRMLQNVDYIHRDWKPENILFGAYHNFKKLYVIDFESAKKLVLNEAHPYLRVPIYAVFAMTNDYCAQRLNRDQVVTWADEYESIGFVLMFLIRGGDLPWYYFENATDDEYVQSKDDLDALCSKYVGGDKMKQYFEYLRNDVEFCMKPNFDILKGFLETIITEAENSPEVVPYVEPQNSYLGVPLTAWNQIPVIEPSLNTKRNADTVHIGKNTKKLIITESSIFRVIPRSSGDVYFTDCIIQSSEKQESVMFLPGREEFLLNVCSGQRIECILTVDTESPFSMDVDFISKLFGGVITTPELNDLVKRDEISHSKILLIQTDGDDLSNSLPYCTKIKNVTTWDKQFDAHIVNALRNEMLDLKKEILANL